MNVLKKFSEFDDISRWEILVKEQVVEILRNTLEKNSNSYNNRKTTKIQVRKFILNAGAYIVKAGAKGAAAPSILDNKCMHPSIVSI